MGDDADNPGKKDLIFEEQIRSLQQQYVFQEDEEVELFLRHYPFLVPFLIDTSKSIKTFFPDGKIFLHTANHAGMKDSEELVAFISTQIEPQKAMEILKQFYSGWWSQAVKTTQGKIAIGLECL